MILLAADTSGKQGSIALARCVPPEVCDILQVVDLAGGTFSAQLIPQVAALLASQGLTKSDIGGFAVASGPGSFTGLRVGLAGIKALAEILAKPIASVSLLHCVADAGAANSLAVLDAGRSEVYVGDYRGGKMATEQLLTLPELIASAQARVVVTPDPAIATAVQNAGVATQKIERPRSDVIARLGWRKIQDGEIVSSAELEANYIRRSDAELFSRPR